MAPVRLAPHRRELPGSSRFAGWWRLCSYFMLLLSFSAPCVPQLCLYCLHAFHQVDVPHPFLQFCSACWFTFLLCVFLHLFVFVVCWLFCYFVQLFGHWFVCCFFFYFAFPCPTPMRAHCLGIWFWEHSPTSFQFRRRIVARCVLTSWRCGRRRAQR